ncbi:MAG: porin PorA family protein [Candidatus Geothermincolia bacterium]
MKHSKSAIILIVLGVLLVAFAPVWRFVIGPSFIKLPADLEVISSYEGTLRVFADRATSQFYPDGQSITTPLDIRAEDRSVESKGNSKVIVLDEHVVVKDAKTGQPLEGVRPDATYVLDRRTCENIPGVIKGVDRTGYTVKFPMLARKRDYPMWDDELGRHVFAEFQRVAKVDGNKHKGIRVYVYKTPGKIEKMARPPAGLPETVSGKQIREMTGMNVPDSASMSLEYYKKTESETWVEPLTGTVVFVPRHHYEYYVKNAPGKSPEYLKLAEVDYARTSSNAREDADNSVKYIRMINADLIGAPGMFLATGVILIVVGLLLGMRATKKARGRNGADESKGAAL